MPKHEGDDSYIFVSLNIKPLTEQIMQLFKPRIENDKAKRHEIDFSQNQYSCFRDNFKKFYDQNYKKYFYKEFVVKN